jgi:predicted Zn-dependent protease
MLTYDDRPLDIQLALELLSPEASPEQQQAFLQFLRLHRHHINDDALLGLLRFLDDHQWQLQALHTILPQLEKPLRKKAKPDYRFHYAAALALLLLASWLLFPKNKPSPDLAAFIPVETGLPNLLSTADQLQKWRPAMQAFTQENHARALIELDKLANSTPENDTLYYFYGVAAFNMQAHDKAIQALLNLKKMPKSAYAADGEYFLALAYWQSGKTELARSALQAISAQDAHPFAEAAKKILSLHF